MVSPVAAPTQSTVANSSIRTSSKPKSEQSLLVAHVRETIAKTQAQGASQAKTQVQLSETQEAPKTKQESQTQPSMTLEKVDIPQLGTSSDTSDKPHKTESINAQILNKKRAKEVFDLSEVKGLIKSKKLKPNIRAIKDVYIASREQIHKALTELTSEGVLEVGNGNRYKWV